MSQCLTYLTIDQTWRIGGCSPGSLRRGVANFCEKKVFGDQLIFFPPKIRKNFSRAILKFFHMVVKIFSCMYYMFQSILNILKNKIIFTQSQMRQQPSQNFCKLGGCPENPEASFAFGGWICGPTLFFRDRGCSDLTAVQAKPCPSGCPDPDQTWIRRG